MLSLTDLAYFILTSSFSTATVMLYFLYLLEKRFTRTFWLIVPSIFGLIVPTFFYVKFRNNSLNFIVTIIVILIIMAFFKPLMHGLFYATIMVVIILLADGVIYCTLSIFSISTFGPIADIALILLIALLVFIFARRFKANQKIDLPLRYNAAFITVPICSIGILYRAYVLLDNNLISFAEVIGFVTILYILNIVSVFMHSKIISYFSLRIENDALIGQIEAFVEKQTSYAEAFTNIYTLQHNMKNQLLPVSSLLDSKNYDLAKERIAEILGEFRLQKYIEYSGINLIDDMINYKKCSAEDILIEVTSDIPRPYDINFIDLSCMIGIALDNAIEASVKNENKKISIKIHTKNNAFIVSISNHIKDEIKRDKSGKILSTKNDNKPHGMGLISIKSLIDENKGELNITISDNIFTISLILFEL